jgi:hypothetical protein
MTLPACTTYDEAGAAIRANDAAINRRVDEGKLAILAVLRERIVCRRLRWLTRLVQAGRRSINRSWLRGRRCQFPNVGRGKQSAQTCGFNETAK